ncbi:MAG TPA: DUF2304 domain-containing protein [bacterium]|nr:DUF2304 domain-containing protein [bacterium]
MLPEQRPFAVITALLLLGLIVFLIRRRKLREEYALLWLMVGAAVIALALWPGLLIRITHLIGAVDPTSALFIFSLIFLMIISIHFSIVNSRLKDQIRDLTQEIALLRHEIEEALKEKAAKR